MPSTPVRTSRTLKKKSKSWKIMTTIPLFLIKNPNNNKINNYNNSLSLLLVYYTDYNNPSFNLRKYSSFYRIISCKISSKNYKILN